MSAWHGLVLMVVVLYILLSLIGLRLLLREVEGRLAAVEKRELRLEKDTAHALAAMLWGRR